MATNIIETFDLTKKYILKGRNKEILALNKVNFSIKEGEIFGLLGPNGAGKTTLVQILTTLLQPTSGYALIDGFNILKRPRTIRDRISLMLGDGMLYNRLSGYQNLKLFSKLFKVPGYKEKIYNITEEFGLKNWLNQYVESYSHGMKMKLCLCRTLIIDSKILFLDEPTLGLDVNSVSFIVKKLKNLNKTIFLTSHDMGVVEKLCNRVAFINKGNVLRIGSKEKISHLIQSEINIEIKIKENKDKIKAELNHQEFISNIIETDDGFLISIKNRENYKKLLSKISNYKIMMVKEKEPSLEELFLKII